MTIRIRRRLDRLQREVEITPLTAEQFVEVERLTGVAADSPHLISALFSVLAFFVKQNRVDGAGATGGLLIDSGVTEQIPGVTPVPFENWLDSQVVNEGVTPDKGLGKLVIDRAGSYLVTLGATCSGNGQLFTHLFRDGSPTGVSAGTDLTSNQESYLGWTGIVEVLRDATVELAAYVNMANPGRRFVAMSAQLFAQRIGENLTP